MNRKVHIKSNRNHKKNTSLGGKKIAKSNNNEDPICDSFAPVFYDEAIQSYGIVGNFKKIMDLVTVDLPLRRVSMSVWKYFYFFRSVE